MAEDPDRVSRVAADLAVRRRVEAALAGDLELRELGADEGAAFNAEVSAAIQEKLTTTNYGKLLAERGVTTAALNNDGDIVEHRSDGTSTVVTK